MSIRVVSVPSPAVGQDWRYVIPGQWVAKLIGVSARLTTTHNPAQVLDTSGNGKHATVDASWPGAFGGTGPFLAGPSNLAPATTSSPNVFPHAVAATVTDPSFAVGAAVSVDYWVRVDALNASGANWGLVGVQQGGSASWEWDVLTGGGNPWDLRFTRAATGLFTVADIVAVGTWVHVGHSWDGVNWLTYKNGALFNTTAGNAPLAHAAPTVDLFGSEIQSNPPTGAMAGIAIYGVALAAARFAAHAAANGSPGAYQTAVLADTPLGLWLMNELQVKTSRQCNLIVTDGTSTVFTAPAGFTVTNAGVFNWSWQNLGPSAAQSVDGSTATVNIPELTLAPGYSVGTRTLDLVSTDQWSNITLWFDDGGGSAGAPGGASGVGVAPYLGRFIVPDYSKREL